MALLAIVFVAPLLIAEAEREAHELFVRATPYWSIEPQGYQPMGIRSIRWGVVVWGWESHQLGKTHGVDVTPSENFACHWRRNESGPVENLGCVQVE